MRRFLFTSIVGLLIAGTSLEAAYTFSNGKIYKKGEEPSISVQEHYGQLLDAYEHERWRDLVREAGIILRNFPQSPFVQEIHFFLGVAYFHLGEWTQAHTSFSTYLQSQATPKFFEQALQYKFAIAREFHQGSKKPLWGVESMPKWLPAYDDAIQIYDEVIAAMPYSDIAAEAMYLKGQLLSQDIEYKASIEAYQSLIRRFPKHSLAAEAFLGIADVFLLEATSEYPNLDNLDLAEINLRKFRLAFPNDPRVAQAEEKLGAMKEVFAKNLLEIGAFYEKTKKKDAALIYYTKILAAYPDTKTAAKLKKRLPSLGFDPDKYLQEREEAVAPVEKQLAQNE